MTGGIFDQLETVWFGVAEERGKDAGGGDGREGSDSGKGRVGAGAESGPVLVGEWAAVAAWAGSRGYVGLRPLSSPLPAALAEQVGAALSQAASGGPAGRINPGTRGQRKRREPGRALLAVAWRELRRRGLPDRFPSHLRPVRGEGCPPTPVREAVRAALRGKRLFASEVTRCAALPGRLFPEAMVETLTWLRLEGEVQSEAAVGLDPDGAWRCRRCGSTRLVRTPCAYCGDPACPVCPDCRLLGEARACRRLYFRPDRESPRPLAARSGGEGREKAGEEAGDEAGDDAGDEAGETGPRLTPAQRRAAAELLDWLTDRGAPNEALLWAVCGAGKTVAVRPVVERALDGGWAVLYASPRRQVLRQVAGDLPRGGLTLATTHQVLRYQEAFDLILVDEPDAYPYRGNDLLQAGLRRAAKREARWLYLTATPEPGLLARAAAGEVRQVLLPRRFHGRPSPVPQLATPLSPGSAEMVKPGSRPQGVVALAAEVIQTRLVLPERRCLVFAPTVALCWSVREELAHRLGVPVQAVDAGSPGRDQTIAAFRRGEFRVLVSTSVLERGVTFPFLDVVVVYAEHPLFDRVSLLQMAGRAGRAAGDAGAGVWLLGREITSEMTAACRLTTALNEAAV